MDVLRSFQAERWDAVFEPADRTSAVRALEQGRLLYFPRLAFPIHEEEVPLFSPTWLDHRAKNISYDPGRDELKGTGATGAERQILRGMLARYAGDTKTLLESLLPAYRPFLQQARTSFRPSEIVGRRMSYRKDDQRLHTDAFPSRPTRGARILRVFTNLNREGVDRVWRIGEPFEPYAERFFPLVKPPLPGSALFLAALQITKGRRTWYDHVMLQLHDLVKGDMRYQKEAEQVQVEFPPGSTWIVFTDQVLHAAMSGQYLMEQTFHLPVSAQRNPSLSPLKVLERLSGRPLVS
jgi:hypothetical protein